MSAATHILVIRFSAMGDVAMTVPVLRALTSQHPQVKVTVVTRAFFKPFFEGIPNVIIAPHSGDYNYARKFSAIIPKDKSNLNELIHLADIVVSEISSVIAEAALLDKPVIQLILPNYPGCFPTLDTRVEPPFISNQIIEKEINITKWKLILMD